LVQKTNWDCNVSAKFGTSGLRGLAGELIGEPTRRYVTAFARRLLATGRLDFNGTVLVGQDFRESSPAIVADVVASLGAQGLQVKLAGAVPTPALALAAMAEGAAAIMVTGSHIPGDRNGIKFYRPDGEIDKSDELAIAALAAQIVPQTTSTSTPATDVSAKTAKDFLTRYAKLLPPQALAGMKIGIYQHSTVARDLLVTVLEGLGAQTAALGRSQHFIPVDTEAVSEATRLVLRQWARAQKLDAIVSADGDGDRPLVADETGEVLRGDLLGLLGARFLNAKTIVTPVTSNSALEALTKAKVIRTRVGSPFVIAAMEAASQKGHKAIVGFEANGGFLTGSDFGRLKALPTRDCFLPILAVLHTACKSGFALSALPKSFPLAAALSDRIENFPAEKSKALMTRLSGSQDNLAQFLAPLGQVKSVNATDGLRATLANGSIIHLRPSGNAPEFRCYVEASTSERAASLMEQSLQLLKSQI
jgi:phosphomannomutase